MRSPYYADDLVELYHGDAAEVLAELAGAGRRFELTFTSPPYNLGTSTGGGMHRGSGYTFAGQTFTAPGDFTGGYDGSDDALAPDEYDRWLRGILGQAWELTTGALYLNHKPRVQAGVCELPTRFLDGVAPLRQVVIWDRARGLNWSEGFYLPVHEWVLVYARADWRLANRQAAGIGDVWRIPPENSRDHPAPFPVELPARALATTGARTVLDPFAGSATTLVAAARYGIRAVGIEQSARYCELAAARLAGERSAFVPLFTTAEEAPQ